VFSWAEKVLALAEAAILLPPEIDPQQAAMLSINPPAAALLLEDFVSLKPGDWIVQNAANSGVGSTLGTWSIGAAASGLPHGKFKADSPRACRFNRFSWLT
jgi:hypothetical protein